MAMARPPSVITLIDWPSHWNTSAVTASDSGMATSEITVVRTDSRNANSTMATMMAPRSRSASATLPTDALMKSAWRNSTRGSARPGGRPCFSSESADSICALSFTVSASGCFWMLTTTAGRPL